MAALIDALPPCDYGAGPDAAVKSVREQANQLAEREQMLLGYIQQGFAEFSWEEIVVNEGGRTLRYLVLGDGIKVEGVRLNGSATLTQQVGDLLGALLPTPKMCDQVFNGAAVKLDPLPRAITSQTRAMVEQSARLDKVIAGRAGICADIGKAWCLVNALVKRPAGAKLAAGLVACNYGWHVPSSPWQGIHAEQAVSGGYVIQGVGTAHERWHVDYSQEIQLVKFECELDGNPTDMRDVLRGPDAKLGSHEGPLLTVRQPGVPEPGGEVPPIPPSPPPVAGGGSAGGQLFMAAMLAAAGTVGVLLASRALGART